MKIYGKLKVEMLNFFNDEYSNDFGDDFTGMKIYGGSIIKSTLLVGDTTSNNLYPKFYLTTFKTSSNFINKVEISPLFLFF